MAQKVAKLGIKRDNKTFIYFIKGGDVWRVARKQPGAKKGKPEKLASSGVTKEPGYLYFLDGNGDIGRAKMMVGGQKRKKKVARKTTTRVKSMAKKKMARGKKR
jgi:hypothetical protein